MLSLLALPAWGACPNCETRLDQASCEASRCQWFAGGAGVQPLCIYKDCEAYNSSMCPSDAASGCSLPCKWREACGKCQIETVCDRFTHFQTFGTEFKTACDAIPGCLQGGDGVCRPANYNVRTKKVACGVFSNSATEYFSKDGCDRNVAPMLSTGEQYSCQWAGEAHGVCHEIEKVFVGTSVATEAAEVGVGLARLGLASRTPALLSTAFLIAGGACAAWAWRQWSPAPDSNLGQQLLG